MKNKAVTRLLKQIAQALESMTKAKSLALNLKSKISDIRARMMIFSLLYLDKRSLLGSIRPNKLRAFLSDHHQKPQQEPSNGSEDQYQISNQVNMVLSSISNIIQDATVANQVNTGYLEEATVAAKQEEEEDLPQSLLEELVFEDPDAGKSAIKMVRDSKELEEGEDSRLEDRIDEVAELFISRFHHQMRMQKQDSFKSLSIHPPPLPS
ncbi:hypothetical protein RHGRI_022669 [Rhododendron griersonianum]|uniref:Uncharacterized protein n=1 Tax=Rhododendron griersonianum TaxID=479676 RepID=A0AAV6J7D1_9ERIC|nr:hypothetical protein RHGRI_022669 [Rhododendron griersonianum]